MKKRILLLFTFLLYFSLNQVQAQAIIFKGGLNMSNMLVKDDETTYSEDFKMLLGWHIGAAYEIPINDLLVFEPGLMFNTRGTKSTTTEVFGPENSDLVTTTSITYNSLDIPLYLKASFEVGDDMMIFANLGPYFGFALSGKFKSKVEIFGETDYYSEKMEIGSDEETDFIKPFDFGLGFGAGFQYSSFFLGVNYNLGLANLALFNEGGYKVNNRLLNISVGYKINQDKKKKRRGKRRRRRR